MMRHIYKARCRICGHEQKSDFPDDCDMDSLECSECGNMTAEAVEYISTYGMDDEIITCKYCEADYHFSDDHICDAKHRALGAIQDEISRIKGEIYLDKKETE